ncbi:acetyl-CoA synthetase-like protein [Lepidopterella palustris CBS 459.81]|uniref:Acetyl-CoA synthetase-like protein n=1 Tax=Lepidopterella palustris CBS 459.81 TaxID=1314670 RepID=A0A8E2E0H9_9PEZI|nr:acetyl-CoA synthetase-like protein [Lepidopterella palustris CBS 459.81]
MDSCKATDFVSWTLTCETEEKDKPLLIDAANPSRYLTFNKLRTVVRQLIAGLKSQGIQPGDCVCINSFNDIFFTAVYLGVVGAGARFTGVNPAYTTPEMTHHLKLTQAKLIIAQPSLLGVTIAAAKICGIPRSAIFVFDVGEVDTDSGIRSWQALLRHGESDWVSVEDPAATVAVYSSTSGTSGLPKMAMLPHTYLVSQAALRRSPPNLSYSSIRLLCLPQFHAFATPLVPASIRYGDPIYIMRRYQPAQFVESIAKYQITETYVAPPVLIGLPKSPLCTKEAMQSIRQIWTGGAGIKYSNTLPMYSHLHPDARIAQVWGMTEVGWVTEMPYPELSQDDSIGRLLPGFDVKVVDDDNNILTQDNEVGELVIKAPAPMLGYLGNKKSTDESVDSEGWLYSGDIGYRCQGKWFVVDRKKDLIKVRAWQVSPGEIESVLLLHPHIIDVGVIGVGLLNGQDEIPKAFVVVRPGCELNEKEVKDFARKSLANYKIPQEVVFTDAIPRNPTGKILRRILKAESEGSVDEGVAKTWVESDEKNDPKWGMRMLQWTVETARKKVRAGLRWGVRCYGSKE